MSREDNGSQSIEDDYYLSSSVFSIRTNNILKLGELQASLVELGVDEILGVKLFSSLQRKLENGAREKAIADAKDKAAFTVKQLDWELGKIISIEYTSLNRNHYYSRDLGVGTRGGRSHASANSKTPLDSNFVDSLVRITFSYVIK